MNTKKGISLIVLVITILVLLIISSTVIYISADASNNAKLVAFASDLQQVEDLVGEYYLTNNELPIVPDIEYNKTQLLESVENGKIELSQEIDLNGDEIFYAIDIAKLDISSTSRGTQENGDTKDVFLVAANSLNVYYLKGQKVASRYYFSLTEELSGKTKIQKAEDIDTSTTTIVGSTSTIILKKSEEEWTNKLEVSVKTELVDGETLKYYIAGQDITSSVTDNIVKVSDILLSNETLKNTFYANENNKIVTVKKFSGETIVTEKTINVSNLDVLIGTVITNSNISYTKYSEYILAKIGAYSDLGGSGLKEIRLIYTTKLDLNGNEIPYYDDLPTQMTKEYVYNSGIKSSSVIYKLPINVVKYSIIFIDNAGNISDVLNATT